MTRLDKDVPSEAVELGATKRDASGATAEETKGLLHLILGESEAHLLPDAGWEYIRKHLRGDLEPWVNEAVATLVWRSKQWHDACGEITYEPEFFLGGILETIRLQAKDAVRWGEEGEPLTDDDCKRIQRYLRGDVKPSEVAIVRNLIAQCREMTSDPSFKFRDMIKEFCLRLDQDVVPQEEGEPLTDTDRGRIRALCLRKSSEGGVVQELVLRCRSWREAFWDILEEVTCNIGKDEDHGNERPQN